MKTFITTTLKTFAILAVMFAGVAFADAATYENDPLQNGTGITSISEGTGSCNGCSGQDTSVPVDIDQPGEWTEVTVYTDYMTQIGSTQSIFTARSYYQVQNALNQSSSTFTFTTQLKASNASTKTDSVTVTNLPSSYKVEYVSGHIENQHAQQYPGTCQYPQHGYDYSVNSQIFNSGGQQIGYGGQLDTTGGNYCAQGTVSVTYRITNTEPTAPNVDVTTTGADNITTSAARLKGRLESGNSVNVWFRYSTSSSVTCSTGTNTNASPSNVSGGTNFTGNISGLTPNTRYYYRACANGDSGDRLYFDTQEVTTNYTYAWEPGEWGSCINNIQTLDFDCVRYPGGDIVADNQCYIHVGPKPVETRECGVTGDDLTITTEPANVDENSATINGEVQTGETGHVFFVWNVESPNVDCVNGPYFAYVPDVNYPLEAGDTFSYTFPNNSITPNTTYHYKACARDDNNNIVSGIRREFTTDDNGGMQHPDANTQSPQDVGEDSAELRGSIDMNDFDNGIVFFVYGQDEDRIADVDNHYDTYNDVVDDEDNDQFEAEFVDGNFDGDDDFTEEVNNLEENERYYYQICVEYDDENNDPRLECGGVEDFETDNNNNNNNNDDTEIETDAPRNVTQTTAEMCGDLVDDGGNSVQTWIEFRNANQSFYNYTPTRQRREGTFCERVSGLTPNTTYIYRACTPDDCAPTRSFRTLGNTIQQGQLPVITTDPVTDIRSNSAVLNGTYVTNAPSGTCRFDYGRTSALGRSTRTYNVSGYGACVHSFTNLASNTQYCVQAVIETVYGTDRGSVRCFTTPPSTGGPTPPPVVVVEDDTEIDLLGLGLGISLVRLDIDDDEEVIIRGENIDYVVSWQNVSELDLFDLELKVVIPPEIQVTDISRGRFDQDENTIYFTIDELRGADVERNIPGEDGDMTISGLVNRGTVGNLVTAEAEISYDNPINDAREDAIAWDIDEYGVQVAGVTASVFGLGNITFLGWLVILLGLFIIFLVARWLYLEREEMRAQAYAGYMPYPAPAPYNGGYAAQANVPMYAEPDVPYMPPVASQPRDTYQPYRPNRG